MSNTVVGRRIGGILHGFLLTLGLLAVFSATSLSAGEGEALQKDSPRSEIESHSKNLRQLMLELYHRNPDELRKSTKVSAEEYIEWVFEGPFGWKFDAIRGLQGVDALELVYSDEYQGDRVLPLIAGLHTLLVTAYGGETEFRFTRPINVQNLYDAAHNVEFAIWKLFNMRNPEGALYINAQINAENEGMMDLMPMFKMLTMRTRTFADKHADTGRVDADLSRTDFIQ